MKELEFKIENIGNETIIYYVDTMEIKSNHLVICNKISENIYNTKFVAPKKAAWL